MYYRVILSLYKLKPNWRLDSYLLKVSRIKDFFSITYSSNYFYLTDSWSSSSFLFLKNDLYAFETDIKNNQINFFLLYYKFIPMNNILEIFFFFFFVLKNFQWTVKKSQIIWCSTSTRQMKKKDQRRMILKMFFLCIWDQHGIKVGKLQQKFFTLKFTKTSMNKLIQDLKINQTLI